MSNEWINVIPHIEPALDKWDVPGLTGKNEWLIENDELVVKLKDGKPCKLLFPIDLHGKSLEWELEFARTSGTNGFNIDIPIEKGPCPFMLDYVYPSQAALINQRPFEGKCSNKTAKRSSIRLRDEHTDGSDMVECWFNANSLGSWSGPRTDLGKAGNEGYPHELRSGLWFPGGEFVFHKIRIKMLKEGVASSLRAVAASRSRFRDS